MAMFKNVFEIALSELEKFFRDYKTTKVFLRKVFDTREMEKGFYFLPNTNKNYKFTPNSNSNSNSKILASLVTALLKSEYSAYTMAL